MITYNQAEYVQQALKSVLDQICDYEFEVIISNDASIDNSDKLIRELIKTYPNGNRVNYFYQSTNLGMNSNFQFAYQICRGNYIAMCEGDDYWSDQFKLQKQVDFLEANPDFALCYHPVEVRFPDGNMEVDFGVIGISDKSESSIYDLAVLGNYIHTPSVIFRNVLKQLPTNFMKTPIGDLFLWILVAQYGKIKRLPDNMAVYRYGVGIHSSDSQVKNEMKFLQTLSLLSESVNDNTVKEILKNRVLAIKSYKLPGPVRSLDDFSDFAKPEVISDYVPIGNLFKSIILKVIRKFK